MQTKNINIERAPNNEKTTGSLIIQQQHHRNEPPEALQTGNGGAPPLPPRTAIIFTPLPATTITTKLPVEVEGYGPYKPVPPPKPYPQQAGQTPPPYRMPPYPLYNEPNIPGAAGLVDSPQQQQQPVQPQQQSTTGINQGLHTHSNKFPIEREVILSNTDKNSKIPILHDYKKRTTKGGAIIAPDIPPKQMAAWTQQQQQQILSPDQNHSGMVQTTGQSQPQQQQDNGPVYRANYHPGQEYYNSSTGAVPRQSWHGPDPNKPAPRPYPTQQQQSEEMAQIDSGSNNNNKDNGKENQQKPAKTMTKTYHTIKDMISSKFKSNSNNSGSNNNSNNNNNREVDEKNEEAGLNNVTEELRRSQRNINEDLQEKKQTDHGIYGKPRIDQYNQHMMLVQQAQINQQIKIQQQYQQQLIQARSQEMLATTTTTRADEQIYYQQSYGATPQRPTNRFIPNQNYSQQMKRSAQQIERDSLRQKSFEARRAASHPQLTYEDETCKPDQDHHRPQPQQSRRGSHGNLVEATQQIAQNQDKDSDDGGFLERNNRHDDQNKDDDSGKLAETLQGTPRKKLEGEIGKIEGVYNVGQRSVKTDDLNKKQSGSGASSDYDKTGGQSSSNADSGRGSAAYSSGRRAPINETDNYAKNDQDSEWVDIVESELRHILEPKLHELSLHGTGSGNNRPNSTLSESISSMTPPLPPLSPGDEQSSPNITPRNSGRYGKHISNSLPYGSKPDYDGYNKAKLHPASSSREQQKWHNGNAPNQKHRSAKKFDYNAILRGKQIFGLDTTDLTSTTTRSLDLESMLDGQTDSEVDLSTADARTIRKQLEGLETMYSEVLKLLGVKKSLNSRYQPSDPRFNKRRCYGSMSSLPSSSVSSRPIRDKRRSNIYDDRKKVRDLRGINKRFQRLESHVVTLARSVAHLSSEMRTQHLMIQEMENIRTEIAALRTQTNMLNVRSQSIQRSANTSKELPTLANPTRVKKLTKFFGDEPPLLRLFLRKLGYEKYANVFENERIGMVELPYLSEERLQKMGVPLGPRLRIMQEAQISVCKENTLCIV